MQGIHRSSSKKESVASTRYEYFETKANINGKPFLYEANGIPSNYSLFNEDEFFAECFTSWIFDKFSGNTKKFFDDVFKK